MMKRQQPDRPAVGFTVQRLNHIAWRCRDADETRAFYEDVLGLPLAHVVRTDTVPSTGEKCRYAHLFFELHDGSYVAFFDLGDGNGPQPDPSTPGWVNHLSLEVASLEELRAAKARLEAAGVTVTDIIDHFWLQSIYFADPNGIHLELSWRAKGEAVRSQFAAAAHAELARWSEDARAARQAAAA
ncbi:MAG: VOC family protein [Lautropia sp.]